MTINSQLTYFVNNVIVVVVGGRIVNVLIVVAVFLAVRLSGVDKLLWWF